MPTIYQIVSTACMVAFIILVLGRTGMRYTFRDWCDQRCTEFFDLVVKMLDCDLCISFWVALALCILIAIATLDASFLLVPVFSTPLTRVLI